jgi:hypothetical protein
MYFDLNCQFFSHFSDSALQVSALQNTLLRGWLHVCDFMCDLLHIADAIWCICDLVSHNNHFLSFFRTKSQMRFGVDAIWCLRFHVHFAVAQEISQQIATPYLMLRVNGSNSVCDTKLQIHQIASAICSKSDIKSHRKLLV